MRRRLRQRYLAGERRDPLRLHLERLGPQRVLLVCERAREAIRPPGRGLLCRDRRAAGEGCPRADGQSGHERSSQERQERLPHISPLVKDSRLARPFGPSRRQPIRRVM